MKYMSKYYEFTVAQATEIWRQLNQNLPKMRDYTCNNYCDFLWVSDLLRLKRDASNKFQLEILKDKKSTVTNVGNVIIFGTIVEVKQVGSKEFLYLIDDGTGVIACKHTLAQFEETVNIIEKEQMEILNETLQARLNSEDSYFKDVSADDSIFNDRSIQIEEVNFNNKSRLKSLQSIWDDIYSSFTSLIEPYNIGDSVYIQGKVYSYFNMNQIYINSIRPMDISEEVMLLTVKLETGLEIGSKELQSDTSKRLSGLITFDNIQHLNPKISIPRNIDVPNTPTKVLESPTGILTPNLKTTITFDTFTSEIQ